MEERKNSRSRIDSTTVEAKAQYTKLLELQRSLQDCPEYHQLFLSQTSQEEQISTLYRFLKAKSWIVPKAKKALLEHWTWRAEERPDLITEEEVQGHVWFKNGLGTFGGFDKENRPSIIFFPALHMPFFGPEDVELNTKTVRWILETLTRRLPAGVSKWTVIVDFTGSTLQIVREGELKVWKENAEQIRRHYPERLGQIIVLNPNFLQVIISKLIHRKNHLSEGKVTVLRGRKTYVEKLYKFFDPEQLPLQYGGCLDCLTKNQIKLLVQAGRAATPYHASVRANTPSIARKTAGGHSSLGAQLSFGSLDNLSKLQMQKEKRQRAEQTEEQEDGEKEKEPSEKKKGSSRRRKRTESAKPAAKAKEKDEDLLDFSSGESSPSTKAQKMQNLRRLSETGVKAAWKDAHAQVKSHIREHKKDRKKKAEEKMEIKQAWLYQKEELLETGEFLTSSGKKRNEDATTKETGLDNVPKEPEMRDDCTNTKPETQKSIVKPFNVSVDMLPPSASVIIDRRTRRRYPWEVNYSELELLDKIGSGGMGEVFRAKWRGLVVAVKKMKQPSGFIMKEDLRNFLREINIMSQLRHPNILLLLGACLDYPNVCIISEFISEGDLHQYLLHEPQPWHRKLELAIDAARGLAFLHLAKPPVLHQDLKSYNLLVDKWGRVKVSDFGISHVLAEDLGINSHHGHAEPQGFGTLNWVAPEILISCEPHSIKTDIYAFGMVLWEILCEKIPYEGQSELEVVYSIAEGIFPTIPESCDPEYADLIRWCWKQDPKERPTIEEVLATLEAIYAKLSPTEKERTPKPAKNQETEKLVELQTGNLKQNVLDALEATAKPVITAKTANAEIIACNSAAAKMFGFSSKEELIGQSLATLASETAPTDIPTFLALLETTKVFECKRKSGERVLIEVELAQVRSSATDGSDEGGFITGTLVEHISSSSSPLTSSLQADESSLLSSTSSLADFDCEDDEKTDDDDDDDEAMYRRSAQKIWKDEQQQSAVLCLDGDGRIVYWSETAEKQFGWTRRDALGNSVTMLMASNDQQLRERCFEFIMSAYAERENGEERPADRRIVFVVKCKRGEDRQGELKLIRDAKSKEGEHLFLTAVLRPRPLDILFL
ncbi:Protein kinase domain-containing protein [Balamuthia mandrillaris]